MKDTTLIAIVLMDYPLDVRMVSVFRSRAVDDNDLEDTS